MTMRKVKWVRFLATATGSNQLWGRTMTTARAEDGYKMRFYPESGILLIDDAKGEGEVAVHTSRCDVYLEPEDASVPKEAAPPPPPAPEPQRQRAAGAPQLK